ncbi:MAG: ATP-binding protein [Planctomycetota bacterium]|nr:ATP-binding protein [Planctomycetota bacterium]
MKQAGQQTRLNAVLWVIIGVSLLVHMLSLVLGKTVLADWRWEHHPVHAAVETVGAVIALIVAWLLISLERRGEGCSFNVQVAAALIGMGLLDGLHALVHAGNCFVWLHSTATFAGGLLFVLVWLPQNWSVWHVTRWPLFVLLVSLVFGLLSLALPAELPRMVQNGTFSAGAMTLNLGGGVLLLLASVRFVLTWRKTRNLDDLLFFLHCVLFGAAAIMFEQSRLWDVPWWGWHLLRLMAYLVALWFVVLTELQAQEKQIETARALHELQTTMEAVPTGMLVANRDGAIVFVNGTLLSMCGWEREELIGEQVEVLLPESFRSAHVEHRQQFMRAPEQRQMATSRTLFAQRRDGSEFPVEVGLSPLSLAEGPCVLAVVVDITQRRLAEQERQRHMDALAQEVRLRERSEAQLRRSNEDLQQFAYVASHDLQEPLRAVAGYCNLLGQMYMDQLDDDGREFLQHAVEGAHRMQALIADLLDYSRVGSRGRRFVELESQELFQAAIGNLSAAITEAAATVTADPLPVIVGDRSQLMRVFQNLIGNALKFRGDRPSAVHVSGRREGDHWIFDIRDNGIGIPEEYQERIFNIFQRLHTRTKYAGTGMGLAICKRIIDLHDGWIRVSSTPGEGSVFTFGIPVREPETDENTDPQSL